MIFVDSKFHRGAQKSMAQLRRMSISWKMQRKGVGRRLIETLLEHAKENKIEIIELQTNGHCPPAVGIYERFGWKAYATQNAPGKPWVDLLLVDYRLEL